jgi:hypothetical protein
MKGVETYGQQSNLGVCGLGLGAGPAVAEVLRARHSHGAPAYALLLRIFRARFESESLVSSRSLHQLLP